MVVVFHWALSFSLLSSLSVPLFRALTLYLFLSLFITWECGYVVKQSLHITAHPTYNSVLLLVPKVNPYPPTRCSAATHTQLPHSYSWTCRIQNARLERAFSFLLLFSSYFSYYSLLFLFYPLLLAGNAKLQHQFSRNISESTRI